MGIEPAEVADEERRKSFAERLLEAIAQGGEAWLGAGAGRGTATREELRSDDVRALIKETIAQTAARAGAS